MELAHTMTHDDRQAFEAVLERHRGIVFKVANSYAGNRADRDDLAQDIAVQLWRAWPGYSPERPVSTWMYRIALNVAISHLRGRSLRERHHVPMDEEFEQGVADTGGEAGAEATRQLRTLHRVIAALPPLDRALMLLYLEERSHREIADVLGISESNVSTKLSRLRQRIRDEF